MVDNGRGSAGIRAGSIWEISGPYVQFSYEPKNALKNKVYWKNFHYGQFHVTNMKSLNLELMKDMYIGSSKVLKGTHMEISPCFLFWKWHTFILILSLCLSLSFSNSKPLLILFELLMPCYSKSSPQTSKFSINWKLVRNAEFLIPSRTELYSAY